MNRTYVVATLVACGLVLLWQRHSLGRLKGDLANKNTELASLVGSNPVSNERGEPVSEKDPSEPSGNRPHFVDLLKLVPLTVRRSHDPDFVRCFPELLRAIEGCSAADLIALAEERHDSGAEDKRSEAMATVLLILAAQEEPERVLAWIEKGVNDSDGSKIRRTAFAALARRDPEKARYLLKRAHWEERDAHLAGAAVFDTLARQDFAEAIDFLREQPESEGGIDRGGHQLILLLDALASTQASRRQILAAFQKEEDAQVHGMLARSLVSGTFHDSGIEGVGQLLKDLEFPSTASRDDFVSEAAGYGLSEAPAKSLEWLLGEISPKNQAKHLAESLSDWARKDHVAAGEWLRAQETFANNSHVVSQLAIAIERIDPAAALEWAGEISSERTQKNTRKFILDQWRRNHPEAAEAWLREQDGETEPVGTLRVP